MTKNEARNDYLKASGERDLYTTDTTADSDGNITGLIILAVICTVLMLVGFILAFHTTLYEDGSFVIGYLNGCLPWSICNG